MIDPQRERLVQRFMDQELSADERMQFVVALGRDSALRERVLELERLVADAGRLARPVVPDGFVARVLEQTTRVPAAPRDAVTSASRYLASSFRWKGTRAASGFSWKRALEALWATRTVRWNLAGAAALGVIVLLAAGGGLVAGLRWGGTPTAGQAASTPASAERDVVLVRLVVVQPGARLVQAAGDFNGWNPSQTTLEQTANGAWTVTLPLEPGRYEYQFVVDGEQWIGDPFAVERNDDGFGSQNAVLDVRPPVETPL